MIPEAEMEDHIRGLVLRDLGRTASAFTRLKGGRNSRVFRVECSDGTVFAAKAYFQSRHDRRDRMGCEYRALQFLKSEGVEQIAAPLASDETRHIAIYEFVDGHLMPDLEIGLSEIDQVVAFLGTLKRIADYGRCPFLEPASEACFSIDAIDKNVELRLQRLAQVCVNEPELSGFLQKDFTPFRDHAVNWCRDFCLSHGFDPAAEIPMVQRTLSPSDFGFHNALKCACGRLVFLDFEYFGWDDPAKTISDFLLHPGMKLSLTLKQHFFAGMLGAFTNMPGLKHRVRAVYPLFGLKWCMILLNEFTIEDRSRRRFSDGTPGAWSGDVQLEKARSMLAQIIHDLQDFPFNA